MRILVTGAAGMLGRALAPLLEEEHEVIGLTRNECELSDESAVQKAFRIYKPGIVVHLAALTNVDGCELDPQKAEAWNALATLNVAKAAKRIDAAVLYTSTDYVFDGRTNTPYTEDAPTRPLNVYGKTKLAGERHVREILDRYFIVRTSWLFGPHGKNFVSTVLRLASGQPELRIVNDQRGSPTYTRHLAEKLAELAATQAYGVYHVAAEGNCTWFEFAQKILELSGVKDVEVAPISTSECGRAAARPAYSVLSHERFNRLGIGPLPHWQAGLQSYLAEIREGGNDADEVSSKRPAYSKSA
ncbi:MAG TPA: dTDP-4-dehydrorhamnose reductase [Terriglobia bacterium]|nr:dTDP-4-dehydrorhamnose reductase [Terriglobia bacterium]